MGNVQKRFLSSSGSQEADDNDLYTKPTGLYDSCAWDERLVRKQIIEKRIAPRVKGSESKLNSSAEECPICFMYYNQVNVSICCTQAVCTECYLQIKPPRKVVECPFCNASNFVATYNPAQGQPRHSVAEKDMRSLPQQREARKSAPQMIPDRKKSSSRRDKPDRVMTSAGSSCSPEQRRMLEERMLQQRERLGSDPELEAYQAQATRRRSGPTRIFRPGTRGEGGSRFMRDMQRDDRFMIRGSDVGMWALGQGNDGLNGLEELMVMQAIRLSMSEAATNSESSAVPDAANQSTGEPSATSTETTGEEGRQVSVSEVNPPIPQQQSAGDMWPLALDDNEQLRLAIALSLGEANNAGASSSHSTGQTTDHNSAAVGDDTSALGNASASSGVMDGSSGGGSTSDGARIDTHEEEALMVKVNDKETRHTTTTHHAAAAALADEPQTDGRKPSASPAPLEGVETRPADSSAVEGSVERT